MKKSFVLSAMFLALPFTMMAQDDDMYFVPQNRSDVKNATDTYYAGSKRDIDEYNRRGRHHLQSRLTSTVEGLTGDSLPGLAPDSIFADSLFMQRMEVSQTMRYDEEDDYRYSRIIDRWYASDPWLYGRPYYWAPYRRGWYYPWYGPSWAGYDPWYDPWLDPWYGPAFDLWYGWGSPWYYSWYYGPYGHWGGYDPWYWGCGYPGVVIGGSRFNEGGIAGTANHGRVTAPGMSGGRATTSGRGTFSGARRGSASTATGNRREGFRRTDAAAFGGNRNSQVSNTTGERFNSRADYNRYGNTTTTNGSTIVRNQSGGSRVSSGNTFGGSRSGGSFSGGSRSSGGGHFGGGRR